MARAFVFLFLEATHGSRRYSSVADPYLWFISEMLSLAFTGIAVFANSILSCSKTILQFYVFNYVANFR